jgi:hypothetical protein
MVYELPLRRKRLCQVRNRVLGPQDASKSHSGMCYGWLELIGPVSEYGTIVLFSLDFRMILVYSSPLIISTNGEIRYMSSFSHSEGAAATRPCFIKGLSWAALVEVGGWDAGKPKSTRNSHVVFLFTPAFCQYRRRQLWLSESV